MTETIENKQREHLIFRVTLVGSFINFLLLLFKFVAGVFAFRCFVGSADAGSLFLPDTFRKQMVRGGFCAKKIQGNGCCFARKQPASFHLLLLAWFCLLGLVRLACSISYVASVSSKACTHIISLIKAWCLYDNGTPALLHNAFPIGERRPE